jgi:hypothetical protein
VKRNADLIRALVLGSPTDAWDESTIEYHRRLLDEPRVADRTQLEHSMIRDDDWTAAGEMLTGLGYDPQWHEVRVMVARGIGKDRAAYREALRTTFVTSTIPHEPGEPEPIDAATAARLLTEAFRRGRE